MQKTLVQMCQVLEFGGHLKEHSQIQEFATECAVTKVSIRCKEKKRAYDERVILMEKGTFTPIVISTSGGVGIEADRHHKRIASLIARKRRQSYADALNYIRTRLRFCLLKSVLITIRGVRGKRMKENSTPISSLSFNLIDFFFLHTDIVFLANNLSLISYLINLFLCLDPAGTYPQCILEASKSLTCCGYQGWPLTAMKRQVMCCDYFHLATFLMCALLPLLSLRKTAKISTRAQYLWVAFACVLHQLTLVSVRPPCGRNFCFLERCF